jgi:small redox-active disulfide protein 2
MEIKILGVGCPKCRSLEKAVVNCLAEMDIAADVAKVDDIDEIMKYGIMMTPGLVINGEVVLSGRVPATKELRVLLDKYVKP